MEDPVVLQAEPVEIVTDGSLSGVRAAVHRLRLCGENRMLYLPDSRISVGVAALKEAGLSGWVCGLSGRREWFVQAPR